MPTATERGGARTRPDIPNSQAPGRPATGFDRYDLLPELLRAVADSGYVDPRPIQEKALPAALEGRDVLGLAQTGTGKTAAFVLPILQRLTTERGRGRGKGRAVRALVVTPTRELASQVGEEFTRLGEHTPVSCAVVFGGVPVSRQVRAMRAGPEVVVACPGRLLDLMGQGVVNLDQIEVLVLDEADHMFDMGFLPDLRRILKALPERRQNLLFSATMPKEIRGLADRILQRPEVVELANARPAETIDHALMPLAEGQKYDVLEHLLAGDDFRSAIVFARTKRRAKRLADKLQKRGHRAISLQGNMTQGQRERALGGFKDGRFDVMVATDIAARGLDIAGVSHVINFDVPNTPDAYTHRIGRTGRSEQTGQAFTFVTSEDTAQVKAIEKRLGQPIERRRPDGTPLANGRGAGRPTGAGREDDRGPREAAGRGKNGRARNGRGADARGRENRSPDSRRGRGDATARPTDSRGPSASRNHGHPRVAAETHPVPDHSPQSFGAGVLDAAADEARRASGAPRPRRDRSRGRRP